ncbi:MAG TPA: hypothetical protein VGM82_03610 [Gemmatimonadaceae bacterium]|jgi:tetratricopeptide (TPR) repeat protein
MTAPRPFVHLNVLDAYRADLARCDREFLGDADDQCLIFATLLHHAVVISPDPVERNAYLRTAFASESCPLDERLELDDADPLAAIGARTYMLAEYAERSGGYALATTIIDLAQGVLRVAHANQSGRLMYLQARILRKLGLLDHSGDVLSRLERLGNTTSDVDLRALAQLGKAILARVRGNYPSARKGFLAALELAPCSSDELDIALHSHHGMLIASAVANDFDSAIRHGAAALDVVRLGEQRTEILANLAAACFDAGEPNAALHGYLQALTATNDPRIRLSCAGGAALAAAHVAGAAVTRRLIEVGVGLAGHTSGLHHEVADMFRELYLAAELIGDHESAAHFRRASEGLARRHGFFEILHRLETPASAPRPSKPVSHGARDIAASMATGDAEQLLTAAASSVLLD